MMMYMIAINIIFAISKENEDLILDIILFPSVAIIFLMTLFSSKENFCNGLKKLMFFTELILNGFNPFVKRASLQKYSEKRKLKFKNLFIKHYGEKKWDKLCYYMNWDENGRSLENEKD